MNVFLKIIWILTILLGIATGVFKILQQEADILLFNAIGISALGTTIIGVVQLIGGILLIPKSTRKVGAVILIPTFILASIAVFANQMWAFGCMSLLFIAMAYAVIYKETKFKKHE